jgi:hypothetical protein
MRIRISVDIMLTDDQEAFFREKFGDRAREKAAEYILKYGMGVVEALAANENSTEQQTGHDREGDRGGPTSDRVFGTET